MIYVTVDLPKFSENMEQLLKTVNKIKSFLEAGKIPPNGDAFHIWENDPESERFGDIFAAISINLE